MDEIVSAPLFKYLESKDVDSFLKGKIKIGTLFGYRNIEQHKLDIGDNEEGILTRVNTVNGTFNNQNELNREWGMRDVITIEGENRNTQFINCTFAKSESSEDLFVLCFSKTRNDKDMNDIGYDACFEITNPNAFLCKISAALNTLAEYKGLHSVSYGDRTIHYTQSPKSHPALLKEARFEYQNEARAIWIPKKNMLLDAKFVQCSKATKYFKRVL